MFKSITVGNVRLFEDEGWNFPLEPLTIFCGTNSAGKSTLLKTLLLLRQNMIKPNNDMTTSRARLQFTGKDVDLGGYDSFIAHQETDRELFISITLEDVVPQSVLNLEETPAHALADTNDTIAYDFKVGLRFRGEPDPDSPENQPTVDGIMTQATFEMIRDGKPWFHWAIERDQGNYFLHPDSTLQSYIQTLPWLHTPSPYRIFVSGLLPFAFRIPATEKSALEKDFIPMPFTLARYLYYPLNTLGVMLTHTYHVAPLRSPAQRQYFAFRDTDELDAAGERLASVLVKSHQTPVENYYPRAQQKITQTLLDALNMWLYFFRTGQFTDASNEEIRVETAFNSMVRLYLKTPSGEGLYDLVDSGFGYSQLLPILVRVLNARRGSVILIEQPELHLNPALQVRLAEFFVAMIYTDKQILLETHSEHLVNAVRVLSAEDETGEIARNSRIYFIDADQRPPKVHDLSIRPDGMVADWPPHFFGEAMGLSGRLLRAQKRFRATATR